MTTDTVTTSKRTISVNVELFDVPGLNTYELMVGILLSAFTNPSAVPSVNEIAGLGRMTVKQTTTSLQGLLDKGILPSKVFRRILGEYGDPRLSWAAKGLLSYMKNNPELQISDLSDQSLDDEALIRRELEQLKKYGYFEEAEEIS